MPLRRVILAIALSATLAIAIAIARAADGPGLPPTKPAPQLVPPADPAENDTAQKKVLDPAHTKALALALGVKEGIVNGKVFTLTLPRTDLDLHTLEFGEVPVEAGLATTLHVWRCGCGKYYILGQFILTDFESNDVLDSLVKGQMRIASVGPILLEEKPRLVQIRFQGEGDMPALIKTLTDCYRWIGENRSKPNPIKLD